MKRELLPGPFSPDLNVQGAAEILNQKFISPYDFLIFIEDQVYSIFSQKCTYIAKLVNFFWDFRAFRTQCRLSRVWCNFSLNCCITRLWDIFCSKDTIVLVSTWFYKNTKIRGFFKVFKMLSNFNNFLTCLLWCVFLSHIKFWLKSDDFLLIKVFARTWH